MQRPAADEHAESFRSYIDRVPDGDVVATLERRGVELRRTFAGVDEPRGAFAYAPGKWTVRRVLQHVVDGERLFAYRAMCIARGETASLPGFDEDLYASNDGSDERRLADIVDEFTAVRAATIALFRGLAASAWQRRGIANGKPASVRALAWITAGHELHHAAVLAERYGIGGNARSH